MDVQPAFVIAVAVVAVAAAVLINYWLIKTDPRPAPKKKPEALTLDAQQLLHDLTRNGAALVKIEVVDPTSVMLRSPRTP